MQWNIIQPLKRERNPAIFYNMDEPRLHYVKQNKLDTERQILNSLTYKQFLKLFELFEFIKAESRTVAARVWGSEENGEMLVEEYKFSVTQDE